jgi:hypothetical protein
MLTVRRNGHKILSPLTYAVLVISVMLCLNACAAIHLNSIPEPSPSSKLRVFVKALSEAPPEHKAYLIKDEEWIGGQTNITARFLDNTGIYEVVPKEDVRAVLGAQETGIQEYTWRRNDYALVRQAGKALHADYMMVVTRGFRVSNIEFKMVLINLETGAQYANSDNYIIMPAGRNASLKASRDMMFKMYRDIFYKAKRDMLATAMRKGQRLPVDKTRKLKKTEAPLASPAPTAPKEEKESFVPPEIAKKPLKTEIPGPAAPWKDIPKDFDRKREDKVKIETAAADKTRIVVYDIDAGERLNIVALILSEALREELFSLGYFTLINRENIVELSREIKLQQSGMTEEKTAVQLGKWLNANEAVTGRLTAVGNTLILQAKRTDIQTLGTLGYGSIKCEAGREDELLSGISGLAKKLAESKHRSE